MRPSFLLAAAAALATTDARAQTHYDVGVEAGISKRFMTDLIEGASNPGFGPVAAVEAHVQVVPMLRLGGYASFELSPLSGEPQRRIFGGGLHARFLPSGLRTDSLQTWIGIGFGFLGVYAPAFTAPIPSETIPPHTVNASFDAAWGHYFEVPVSIGVAQRIGSAWEAFGQLGVRFGFAMGGDYYDGRAGTAPTLPDITGLRTGSDTLDVMLTLGVQLDR